MTEVQAMLLKLLKEIDVICKENNIKYYLGGGTLIGAIRHGGFLPWDDDADVHMSREDAEKFVSVVERKQLPDRTIYHGMDDNGASVIWRYQDTQSTMFMRSMIGNPTPKSQFIDILVNYPLPPEPKEKEKCIEAFQLYMELKFNNGALESLRESDYLKKYFRLLRVQKLVGRNRVLRYLESKAFQYKEEDAEEIYVRTTVTDPAQTIFPKSFWGTPRYVPFEDTMLPVAEYAEKVLAHAFSPTWFELPAYMEHRSHLGVVDHELPYTAYETDMERRFDVPKFYQEEIQKKQRWFRILRERNVVMPQVRELQGISTCLELEQKITKLGLDLKAMTEQDAKKELETLFEPYIAKVTSFPIKYYGVYLDMPDEYLYAALYFRCFDGNYGLAKKILNQRRSCVDRELSPDLRRLCDICDATDEMLTALYGDLDMDRTRELVDEWLAKEPTALYFQRADMNLRLSCDRRGESAEELLRRCEGYLEQYPDDGELLKYKGDILRELGSVQEGEKCYKMALCNIKNGMVIKAVKEYFAAKPA